MQRITSADNVAVLPAPIAPAASPGYFNESTNPLLQTTVSVDWCNSIQEELISILTAAGITPAVATNNQVVTAIGKLLAAGTRIRLTANTSFYVNASSGNDTTGIGTSALPWATLQHAASTLQNSYDLAGFVVTFACTGTFTAGVLIGAQFIGQTLASSVVFDGGGTAQINVVSSDCFNSLNGGKFVVQNFGLLSTSGSTSGGTTANVFAINQGTIYHQGNNFGSCVGFHMSLYGSGAIITALGNYTISGSAIAHISNGLLAAYASNVGITITLTGTPAFSSFVAVTGGGAITSGSIFSGAATGPRYSMSGGGIIQVNGAGATYFPGNSAGTNDGTGIYQ